MSEDGDFSIVAFPCPDEGCVDGKITVYNAYVNNGKTGRQELCDRCNGKGVVFIRVDDESTFVN